MNASSPWRAVSSPPWATCLMQRTNKTWELSLPHELLELSFGLAWAYELIDHGTVLTGIRQVRIEVLELAFAHIRSQLQPEVKLAREHRVLALKGCSHRAQPTLGLHRILPRLLWPLLTACYSLLLSLTDSYWLAKSLQVRMLSSVPFLPTLQM